MSDQSPPALGDRIRGSIFGLAITDALGSPVEFKKRGTFEPVTGFRYAGTFGMPAGTWTDDTSMSLCLAQSLIDTRGTFTPQNVLRNFIRWYSEGYLSAADYCFDIGNGTRTALGIWERWFKVGGGYLGDSEGDVKGHEKGLEEIKIVLSGENCCGNGSLMRASPIPLVYSHSLPTVHAHATTSSNLTHPHPANADACLAYSTLIARALRGAPKADLARELGSWEFKTKDLKKRFEGMKTVGDWEGRAEAGIKSTGWVVDTLEASCWAFFSTGSFEEGALKVVNLGDDADTVGAIYGALAGAYYGVNAIPKAWMEGLVKKEVVGAIANGLVELAEKEPYG
ncbi:MAG: hypothetical protein M1839_002193 [Geoglossum umbratile]|nr:MAG: hypothetical protein M1839_002193 [Geoglossum umbratile]